MLCYATFAQASVEVITPHRSEDNRVTSHDINTQNAPQHVASVDPARAKQGYVRTC